jgi:ankyrin repeat protein
MSQTRRVELPSLDETLLQCVGRGDMDLVKRIINLGANISKFLDKLLSRACSQGHLEIAYFILDKWEKGHSYDTSNLPLLDGTLHQCIGRGDMDLVKRVVDLNVNISKFLDRLLSQACSQGHLEIAYFILDEWEKGRSHDTSNLPLLDETLLQCVGQGDMDLVKRIIDLNVNISVMWEIGYSYDATKHNEINHVMITAASAGELGVVKRLRAIRYDHCAHVSNILYKNNKADASALCAATGSKEFATMKFLLDHKVEVTRETLLQACERGYEDELKLLGTDVHSRMLYSEILNKVAADGNVSAIEILFQLGAQFSTQRNKDWKPAKTPLAIAAGYGSVRMVEFMLQKFGTRIIHYGHDCEEFAGIVSAASQGSVEVVKLLVGAGADLETQDASGRTALCAALESNGQENMIRFLLYAGANSRAANRDGKTILHVAAEYRRQMAVKWLLDADADPKAVSKIGTTVLSSAMTSQLPAEPHACAEVVKLLLDAEADPEEVSSNGKSGIEEAFRNNKEAFKTILDHPLWSKGSWSRTIRRALRCYSEGLIIALVEHGLELTNVSEEGHTLLDSAIKRRMVSLVRFLLKSGATAFGPFAPEDVVWVEYIRNDINRDNGSGGVIILEPFCWKAKPEIS